MILLIQINGHKSDILKANGLDENAVFTVKVDEKELAKPGKMKKIVNGGNYESILFGCIELSLQRFQTFMKFYILLSKSKKGAIVDESGNSAQFSLIKHLFAELPMLALEAVVSIIVAGYFYIKLPILKWLWNKRS
jgi:hypothetical protein